MKNENVTDLTIYDSKLQDYFETWVIEAGIKLRFNTATYFVETIKMNMVYSFLKKLGFNVKTEKRILHVVTNHPGNLLGIAGTLYERYERIFIDHGFDAIALHEIRNQDRLLKGIKYKLSEIEIKEKNAKDDIKNAVRNYPWSGNIEHPSIERDEPS